MKKLLVLLSICASLQLVSAQSILNSDFEKWNTTSYNDPKSYRTSNLELINAGGGANITRITDKKSGSFAIQLMNSTHNGQDYFGGLFLGNPGQGGLTGGAPFTERPDSFGFYIKSQLMADTGFIYLFFKKEGDVIGVAGMDLMGNQNKYTRMCSEISFFSADMPDTVAMVVFSGDMDVINSAGSFLQLDSLFFIGATQKLPNPSFEVWQNLQSETVSNWVTSNDFLPAGSPASVVKSTDKHGGNFSIKITTALGDGGSPTGFITNGNMDDFPYGGTKINNNPQKFGFWYKSTPLLKDSAIVLITTTRHDAAGDSMQEIFYKAITLNPATNWTYKEISFTYNQQSKKVDSIFVAFAASNFENNQNAVKVGSTLLVDDISIAYYPNAIDRLSSQGIKAWPVPASSSMCLSLDNDCNGHANLQIIGMNGAIVMEADVNINDGKAMIDIADLPNGNYLSLISLNGKDYKIPFIVRH